MHPFKLCSKTVPSCVYKLSMYCGVLVDCSVSILMSRSMFLQVVLMRNHRCMFTASLGKYYHVSALLFTTKKLFSGEPIPTIIGTLCNYYISSMAYCHIPCILYCNAVLNQIRCTHKRMPANEEYSFL